MTTSSPDFAHSASEYLRAQGEARPIRYDAERHRLVVGAEGDWVSFVSLGHAQREYEAMTVPEQARVLARRFWSSVRRPHPPLPAETVRFVVPRLRDRAWFSAVRRQAELELGADEGAIEDAILPHHVVNDELAVHLAFDLPTSVMELASDRIAAFGLSFDELFAVAVKNLSSRPRLEFERPDAKLAAFVSPYRDGFDATRLLLADRFLELPLEGRPVVLAPTHDVVLVAGDEDEEALEAIAGWGEQALLEPKPNTAHAFRWTDDGWKPWLPQRPHRAWQKLKVLQLQSFASAYARQKEVLESLLQANGHSLFVGTLRAFKTATGDIFTSTTWTDGVDGLIPQTDRIDFVQPGADGTAASGRTWSTTFEVARETLGEMMAATGDTPERWRVNGFPSPAQLEQMAQQGRLPD